MCVFVCFSVFYVASGLHSCCEMSVMSVMLWLLEFFLFIWIFAILDVVVGFNVCLCVAREWVRGFEGGNRELESMTQFWLSCCLNFPC